MVTQERSSLYGKPEVYSRMGTSERSSRVWRVEREREGGHAEKGRAPENIGSHMKELLYEDPRKSIRYQDILIYYSSRKVNCLKVAVQP